MCSSLLYVMMKHVEQTNSFRGRPNGLQCRNGNSLWATPADSLRAHLATVRHALSKGEVEELARGAHAFVAADLAALVAEAAITALRRCIASPHPRQRQVHLCLGIHSCGSLSEGLGKCPDCAVWYCS